MMKWGWWERILFCLGFALVSGLLACSGGPAGSGAISGGALDAGGNYAAGPMSLPAPSIINKNMIYCDNVAGPTVECRGTAGAVPANSRIKLTVYDRFSDRRSWTDWLLPSANAFPGNFDFCNANAAGAFGQTGGDCSVVAMTGEKIGICIASGDTCASPELVLTVPVEGGTSSGASGVIKAMSASPDGSVIIIRRSEGPARTQLAFRWTDLFFGTAQAQEAASVPTLTPPAAQIAACSNPNVSGHFGAAYVAPKDQVVTVKSQKDGTTKELFKLPGSQDDVSAVNADRIGNIAYVSVGLKNTLFIVDATAYHPMAQIVFPAPIKSMRGGSSFLEVLLQVPKGDPAVYHVAADSFDTACVDTAESRALTGPNSFVQNVVNFQPPGAGYLVPIPFNVYGSVGKNESTGDFQVYYRQDEVPSFLPAYENFPYHQATLMKDFQFLSVTQDRMVGVVLDPGANRLIFVVRDLASGDNRVLPVSLEGVTTSPVTMRMLTRYSGDPLLVLMDSGERGAKAVMIPVNLGGTDPQLSLREIKSMDLGPIVADSLELTQPRTYQWATFDRVAGQVVTFSLGPAI